MANNTQPPHGSGQYSGGGFPNQGFHPHQQHQPGNPTPHGHPQAPGQHQHGQGQQYQQFNDASPNPNQPQAKKPFWKRTWFIIIAGLFGLGFLVNLLGGGSDADEAAPASDPVATDSVEASDDTPEASTDAAATTAEDPGTSDEAAPAEEAAESDASQEEADESPAAGAEEDTSVALGQEFTIDDWAVTIVGVGEPVNTIGDEFLSTEAQGQFLPVEISARNVGTEENTFFADSFKLVDDKQREFSYSSDATFYGASEGAVSFLDSINPGNTLAGKLYFDVPTDATVTAVKVEGGWFTEPVSVAIS